MLTGNEPVSTGNLRASLGNFSHHRAGAYYETPMDTNSMKTELKTEMLNGTFGGNGEYLRIPIPASTMDVAGGTFENGLFVPDRPGVFSVVASATKVRLSAYSDSDRFAAIVKANDIDIVMSNLNVSSMADFNFAGTVVVPPEGIAMQFRILYKYANDRRVQVTMSDLRISILEI